MLVQCWPNIELTLDKRLEFAGMATENTELLSKFSEAN